MLVFLTAPTVAERTFTTTRSMKIKNTVTVDFAAMATSNGENGGTRMLGYKRRNKEDDDT